MLLRRSVDIAPSSVVAVVIVAVAVVVVVVVVIVVVVVWTEILGDSPTRSGDSLNSEG